jgi:competence protein ComEC
LGGTRSLLENVKADRILTASPQEVPIEGVQSCQAGDGWTWDGVRFSILHPPEGERLSGNNASCVLRVEGSNGQVLLTGDIEPAAQAALVDTYGAALAAEVLVAPSHGGGGLLLADFLAAVQPRYVLFSTGYNNRAGFPRPETVESYREAGATVLDTVSAGAITFHLDGWGGESVPALYRQQARRYWRADP